MNPDNQNQTAPAKPPAHADAHHDENPIPADLPKVGSVTIGALVVVGAVILAGLFVLGYVPHRNKIADAKKVAEEADAKPMVSVAIPKRVDKAGDIVLPADAQAFQETAIYPRANGYLKQPLVDIGDKVKQGQLLAEIESPELDSQVSESKAAVEQSKSNLNKAIADADLAQTTLNRYETLSKTAGAITQQDLDEKRSQFNQAKAALEAAKANVNAAQAAVQRLTDLQAFEKVTAPFDGVISARNYDRGALLAANSTSGKELFRLVRSDTLRVFINVPQSYASGVKMGQDATFEVRNFPGKKFHGVVTRSTGSIDPSTRTLKFQVDVDNKDGQLWAGMYGTMSLPVIRPQPPLLVPSSALVYMADGPKVATVVDGIVKLKKIDIGRDLGQELEVTSGLTGDEQVVSNPGERVEEGVEVQIASTEHPVDAAPANPGSPTTPKTQTAARQ